MKKKLMSVILSSLVLMGAIGGIVNCVATTDDPPFLVMNTERTALTDDPPFLV